MTRADLHTGNTKLFMTFSLAVFQSSACVRKPDPTFDFLISASYFLPDSSNTDDGLHFREGGEGLGLQRHHGSQETGGLGGVRETGRRGAGARPVVHLEEKEEPRKQIRNKDLKNRSNHWNCVPQSSIPNPLSF